MPEIVQRGLGVESCFGSQSLERLGEAIRVDGATVATITDNVAAVVVPRGPERGATFDLFLAVLAQTLDHHGQQTHGAARLVGLEVGETRHP